ncbi:Phosphatidylinositol 4-kinase gamma 2 [Capsicum chinense]|nr:Phosphatidylinositol 4-kinase gamma 2 [Capsicum chinense]
MVGLLSHIASKIKKVGSLQLFKKNEGNCEDMGPGIFLVEEVHKITVFDIRTANADRHAGNILVSIEGEEGRIVLTPIDHGYYLPENISRKVLTQSPSLIFARYNVPDNRVNNDLAGYRHFYL